jgi:hypothetical protein
MTTLSRHFGVAQFYGTHRVSTYVTWAIYEEGVARRVFAWCDGVLLNSGSPLPQEAAGVQRLSKTDIEEADDDFWMPHEDNVFELAGKWSINPLTLETLSVPPSVGLVGKLD